MTKKLKTNLAGTTVETFIAKSEIYLKALQKDIFKEIHSQVNGVFPKLEKMKELQAQAQDGSHRAVALRNELRKEVNRDMTRLCDWVNIHAHHNEKMITESAFEGCKPRTAATIPSGIKKLVVYRTTESGRAQICWKGNGSKFYRTQMTVDPTSTETWKDVATVTSNKCELQNLPVGKFCYFRVQGVNSAGAGEFSDVYIYMAS